MISRNVVYESDYQKIVFSKLLDCTSVKQYYKTILYSVKQYKFSEIAVCRRLLICMLI